MSSPFPAADIKVNNLEIKKLSSLSPWKCILAISVEWSIIIGAATLHNYYPFIWLYIPVWLLIATRLYALYSLIHEAIHYSILRNKKGNDTIAQLFLGLPLFIDVSEMRTVHYDHHKYLRTEKDPENKHLQYPEFQFPMSGSRLFLIFLKDLSGFNFLWYKMLGIKAWIFSNKKTENINGRKMSFIFFYIALFAISVYFNFTRELFIYWIFPFVTLYQLLNRIRLSTEHYNIAEKNPYQTRTVILNGVQSFFLTPYNLGYHLEHHLYPGVPFYNLPALHKLLLEEKALSGGAMAQTQYGAILKNLVK